VIHLVWVCYVVLLYVHACLWSNTWPVTTTVPFPSKVFSSFLAPGHNNRGRLVAPGHAHVRHRPGPRRPGRRRSVADAERRRRHGRAAQLLQPRHPAVRADPPGAAELRPPVRHAGPGAEPRRAPLIYANSRFALRLGGAHLAMHMEFYGGRTRPMCWKHTAMMAEQGSNATAAWAKTPVPVYGRLDDGGFFPCASPWRLRPGGEAQCQCLTNGTSTSPPCQRFWARARRLRRGAAGARLRGVQGAAAAAVAFERACAGNCGCWGALHNGASGYCYLLDFPVETLLYEADDRKAGYFKGQEEADGFDAEAWSVARREGGAGRRGGGRSVHRAQGVGEEEAAAGRDGAGARARAVQGPQIHGQL
jgi:hypothetical protein